MLYLKSYCYSKHELPFIIANLDEGFAKNINVTSIDAVGDAVKDLSERIMTGQQIKVDKILEEKGVPANGAVVSPSQMEVAVSNYAKGLNSRNDEGGLLSKAVQAIPDAQVSKP